MLNQFASELKKWFNANQHWTIVNGHANSMVSMIVKWQWPSSSWVYNCERDWTKFKQYWSKFEQNWFNVGPNWCKFKPKWTMPKQNSELNQFESILNHIEPWTEFNQLKNKRKGDVVSMMSPISSSSHMSMVTEFLVLQSKIEPMLNNSESSWSKIDAMFNRNDSFNTNLNQCCRHCCCKHFDNFQPFQLNQFAFKLIRCLSPYHFNNFSEINMYNHHIYFEGHRIPASRRLGYIQLRIASNAAASHSARSMWCFVPTVCGRSIHSNTATSSVIVPDRVSLDIAPPSKRARIAVSPMDISQMSDYVVLERLQAAQAEVASWTRSWPRPPPQWHSGGGCSAVATRKCWRRKTEVRSQAPTESAAMLDCATVPV